jgi:membrane-associated protease RseP (regulator of RpoE activity)
MSLGLPNNKDLPVLAQVSDCVQDYTVPFDAPCPAGAPSPAKSAGLKPGDQIVSIAGKPIATWSDMQKVTRDLSGPNEFKVLRDGKEIALTVDVPKVTRQISDGKGGVEVKQVGAIGVIVQQAFTYGPIDAIPAAVSFTGDMFVNTWKGLMRFPERIPAVVKAIGGGERDLDTPISVVGASRLGGDAAERGLWAFFILMLAGLNFFVGVFNLLPLLPLDGGHIAVNLYERVRDWLRKLRGMPAGAPVNYMRLLPLTYVVIFIGGAITLLTVTADIVNPIRLQ